MTSCPREASGLAIREGERTAIVHLRLHAIQTCSNDPIQAGCVPRPTLTKLPNLNSSQRNCTNLGYLAISVWYSIRSVLFGSSRYLLLPRPFRARTTGPAYQSQTQAEERGTALHMCNLPRAARPRRRVRHPSTVECILSGPGATLNAMSGSTQWVCGSTLFMLACRVILQVHNPQPVDSGVIRPGAVL